MQLAALSIGYGVDPEGITGRVAGIFPRACVIKADDGSAIALVPRDAGNLPGGIVVDAAENDFAAIAVGASAQCRAGVLRFEASDLSVDLRTARPWRSGLDAMRLDLGRDASRDTWRRVAALLAIDGRAQSFATLAAGPLAALSAATNPLIDDQARDAAGRLIGLGQGTTPDGDDLLVGFLGALWAAAADPARRTFVQQLGAQIIAVLDRTHWVSRVYLAAAAVGEVSERLAALLGALAQGDGVQAEHAARAALAVGHSSGACGVLGVLAGAAAWDAPELVEAMLQNEITPEPFPPVPA